MYCQIDRNGFSSFVCLVLKRGKLCFGDEALAELQKLLIDIEDGRKRPKRATTSLWPLF